MMKLCIVTIVVCLCSIQMIAGQSPYTVNDTTTLQSDLLSNYDKRQRPSSKTDIIMEFGLMHITELDIVTQRMHSMGFLAVEWTDERLQWTAALYGNITESMFLASDIWVPPLLLSNEAEEFKIIGDNSDFASGPTYVLPGGYVIWLAPAHFTAQCTINIKYYPFDSQVCKIVVSSWMYLDYMIDLGTIKNDVNLDIYEEHGEWEILGTTVANITRTLHGYKLPAVEFRLQLGRKKSYYLLNMLLPVIILALMAPFVFVLPVESGEKIGFALTILLSLSVVMTIVSDNIPPTSTHICVLSVYLLLTFILCSVQTIVTVLVCGIHELHNKTYIIGGGCKKVIRILAQVTRYRRRPKMEDTVEIDGERSPNVVVADSNEKIDLSKNNKTAWVEDDTKKKNSNMDDQLKLQYTYEDMVIMLEKFNFILFTVLTLLTTFICMIILETNGGESVE